MTFCMGDEWVSGDKGRIIVMCWEIELRVGGVWMGMECEEMYRFVCWFLKEGFVCVGMKWLGDNGIDRSRNGDMNGFEVVMQI
ncbi:hypothetical protein, partial [Bacillus altitudinis]|uniref:hypothetical protein n=1 Tax=Bacillus altitudinis TaxID=293387 RepID=UPI001C930C5B